MLSYLDWRRFCLAPPRPAPLDSGLRRNDGTGDWWDSEALSKPRHIIFVRIARAGWRRRCVCVFRVVGGKRLED